MVGFVVKRKLGVDTLARSLSAQLFSRAGEANNPEFLTQQILIVEQPVTHSPAHFYILPLLSSTTTLRLHHSALTAASARPSLQAFSASSTCVTSSFEDGASRTHLFLLLTFGAPFFNLFLSTTMQLYGFRRITQGRDKVC
jgi:hypothetical protein